MKNPARSAFVAVFQTEVLLNTKRVAPYAMAILFAANALLWWGWGPAGGHGWATNSDYYIASVLPVYSFLTLPLFTALIMADPVIRDFRTGIAPLIFSKPVSRAEYLLGKFLGNFFVLACCQAAFVATLFALQAFQRPGMLVQEVRLLPYLKHFLVFIVVSHLLLAAFYFTAGTLTRNAKVVYGLGVAFYPLYMTWQVALLKNLPPRWQSIFDPLLMNWGKNTPVGQSAEWVNQYVVTYDSDLIANRVLMILVACFCLAVAYLRFRIAERGKTPEGSSTLSLSTAAEDVYYDSASFREGHTALAFPSKAESCAESPVGRKGNDVPTTPLPAVDKISAGIQAQLDSLRAATGVEFRLLRSERGLLVILPLAPLLAFLSLPLSRAISGETYSAAYASSTANGVLIFLLGVIVFFTGEAMHRDREVRIEPVLWSTPVSNAVILLSKFLTTISVVTVLIVLVGLTAMTTQLLRGRGPVDVSAYLITYAVILFPTVFFVTAGSVALSVWLRDKYFTYATSIAIGAGLFYVYHLGYNHWLYNPALYQLWTYADLTGTGNAREQILTQRLYCLAVAGLFLALAQLGLRRKSAKGLTVNGRLGSKGWTLVVLIVSAALAVATGSMIK